MEVYFNQTQAYIFIHIRVMKTDVCVSVFFRAFGSHNLPEIKGRSLESSLSFCDDCRVCCARHDHTYHRELGRAMVLHPT